ncbi:hypothetical protein FPZ12_040535 [Amycolatopsis acidicola]|uniref:DUF5313 domain-containing protein n=1 Tax=Amycolatopsis acidicola TaxID=2596893 RepID=A0A5N0UQA3_9PSEU|nr:DUF5313 domain-containing protein [Amycolatopsis acidicola]KAA9150715.1 hypothetical protein FPZ12_040535 [Amycolatopsis acidicola]
MADVKTRPNPVQWLWYALGGRLPERCREWVLHDTTSRTWVWRHAARSTVLLAPLMAVWLLLPAPIGLRLALVLMAALVGYFYSFVYMEEAAENRLAKHGYPRGTGKRIRAEAHREEDEAALERYIAQYRSGRS